MAKYVDSILHVRPPRRPLDPVLNLMPHQGRGIGLTENPWSLQVTVITQHSSKSWNDAVVFGIFNSLIVHGTRS